MCGLTVTATSQKLIIVLEQHAKYFIPLTPQWLTAHYNLLLIKE